MSGKKIFKKLIQSFGGYALYLNKSILDHLKLKGKDEVRIEFIEDAIVITKADLSDSKIEEMLKFVIQKIKR